MFETDSLAVTIEWESDSGCSDFTISLVHSNDPSLKYNITTKSTYHTFYIFYNTNYTVTVSSSSGSNSSEISKSFNFGKCSTKQQLSASIIFNFIVKCERPSHRELECDCQWICSSSTGECSGFPFLPT